MLTAVVIVVLFSASGVGYWLYLSTPTASRNVTFMLDFAPNSQHAPYYYGVQQGYYKQNGVNLTILPSKGTVAAISAVAAGQVDFALADTSGLIQAVSTSNITNVKIVSMVFAKNFYGVIYNTESIKTPADLAGKSGAASVLPNIQTSLFTLFAKLNNVNFSSLKMQYATPGVYGSLLTQGKVQFVTNPVHNLPTLRAAALASGIQLGVFPFSSYGVDVYGQAIITSTQTIQAHPDLVRSFVAATMQSVVGAIRHPQDAVAALTRSQPQLNATTSLAGFESDVNCCMANATGIINTLTFGWIDPTTMQHTVNESVLGFGLKAPVNASSLYTDDLVAQP